MMVDSVRTPEQLSADKNLTEAIERCLDAYEIHDSFTVTDYAILLATQKLTDEGVVITSHPILFMDGDMPWYRAIGLIETHRSIVKTQITAGGDNG